MIDCLMAEMNVKLVMILAAVLLVAQTVDAVQETQGLYMLLRNETTRLVSARQLVVSPTAKTMAGLSSWSVDLGQCSVNVEIVGYSTMDTVRKTFIGNMSQLMSRLMCFLNGSGTPGG